MTAGARALLCVVVVAVATVGAAVPANAQLVVDPAPVVEEPADRDERLGRDPFGAMGGSSPFCNRGGLAATERRNCRASGALAHPVRIDHYGFDIHVDTGLDNITGNFAKGLQDLAQMAWMTLLYLIKGTSLGLEWAFSLDLLGEALPGTRTALDRMQRQVLGDGWLAAAIAAAGLWGIFRGLVQRRSSEALSGLAVTVLLIAAGLVVVSDPAATVGRASSLANQAALGIVAGATTGSTRTPARGFGEAMRGVFDQVALRPWCALQFSDVAFCLSPPRQVIAAGDLPDDSDIRAAYTEAATVAELFLRFEPNGRGRSVGQRDAIYERWKRKEGHRLQAVVRIQKEPSTGPRLALLALIAIGQLGMILLFGWIAMRLLGYGGLAVALLLAAPVMLLAPALGDSGRGAFVAWVRRLAGALVAKAVYAVLLAVVLLASGALAELQRLGWIAVWLLQAVVWWTLFLRRDEIVALATSPGHQGAPQRSLLQRVFYTHQMAASAGRAVTGGAVTVAQQTVGRLRERRSATDGAVRTLADRKLRQQAGADIARRHHQARDTVARDRTAAQGLSRAAPLLADYDRRSAAARERREPAPTPTPTEVAALSARELLASTRPPPQAVKQAERTLTRTYRAGADRDAPPPDRDVAAYAARRRREIDTLPSDHERNLRAAGIDPDRYRNARGADRERLRSEAEQALASERARLDAASITHPAPPSDGQLRKARETFSTTEVRAARREQTRALRAQRRGRRHQRQRR